MTKNNGFKVAALAASIALAMGSSAAFAADPAANALPGQGKVLVGAVTPATPDAKTLNLTVTTGAPAVINWGVGTAITDINPSGTAGFNIGSAATVNVTATAATDSLLNIDSTGNPSQIFGKLAVTGAGNVYVANSNGIIVGASGVLTGGAGTLGLVANTLKGDGTDFTGTLGTSTEYNGTGGNVTVAAGTSASTGTILISGGGTVNVNLAGLSGATTTVQAGRKAGTSSTLADNTAASAVVTGGSASTITVADIDSAGTATTNGMLTVTASTVDGVLTNNGKLVLPATVGDVVNQGDLSGATTFDSLTNAGSYTSSTGITIAAGDLTNTGTLAAGGALAVSKGALTNSNAITGATSVAVTGGNLSNTSTGKIDSPTFTVTNGAIDNAGKFTNVTNVDTASDDSAAGYTAGGQYYINNSGSITEVLGNGGLAINANSGTNHVTVTANNSTGSFTNTGTLALDAAGDTLKIVAQNNVNLGGTLKTAGAALASGNALGTITLTADAGTNDTGVLTVSAPLFGSAATFEGNQVKVMQNVTATGAVAITAGAAPTNDYSVRIAAGTTTKGATVKVDGRAAADQPSTILQGTISSPAITFGGTNVVGDIISGPAGGLSGANPTVIFNFAGRLKTAPYLNNANNFRYNYLPITNTTAGGSTALTLNAVDYQTNGTSNGKAGVNLLVKGDVTLTNTVAGGIDGTGSAVTGVTNLPNTHLVLQSTGGISTAGYWPGYVYLGTIDSDSSGNALPGTLSSAGKITLTADFNNVLPGDVAGASGIHFMSGTSLAGTGKVTTNANAWINFPTDLLTQSYTQGLLTTPTFYAGTATGLIVNYAAFTVGQTQQLFNTHPVDASK